MNIMVTAATDNEWKPVQHLLSSTHTPVNNIQLQWHTSGVGIMLSTLSLYKELTTKKPEFILQVGIAGSFDPAVALGSTVLIKDEYLGDTGVEEGGKFNDTFDLHLTGADTFPFQKKALINPWIDQYNLLGMPLVSGITVNEITTNSARIKLLTKKYGAQVETMEGAALHFAALYTEIPFLQIRAISNYVGERDKNKWQLKRSLEQLAITAADWLVTLDKQLQKK